MTPGIMAKNWWRVLNPHVLVSLYIELEMFQKDCF